MLCSNASLNGIHVQFIPNPPCKPGFHMQEKLIRRILSISPIGNCLHGTCEEWWSSLDTDTSLVLTKHILQSVLYSLPHLPWPDFWPSIRVAPSQLNPFQSLRVFFHVEKVMTIEGGSAAACSSWRSCHQTQEFLGLWTIKLQRTSWAHSLSK